MVKEKKRHGSGDPIVNHVFSDPAIGFLAVDRYVKRVFYEELMEPLESLFKWMMNQKEIAKEIVREESGQQKLPKTPQRNNPFIRLSASLDTLRTDLTADNMSGFTNEEDHHYHTRAHTAARTEITLKACTPQFIPREIKQEILSVESPNYLRSREVTNCRDYATRTAAASASRSCAQKLMHHEDHRSGDLFTSSEKKKTPTPGRTPASPSRLQRQQLTKVALSPYVDAVRAVVAKQEMIRKALSPGRPIASVTQPSALHQPSVVKVVRNSELVSKMEAKAKIVITNREAIVRERAERTKREREERARRVQRNNRKKEEEQAARLAIIRRREQEIEEIRKQQASPSKGLPRIKSAVNWTPLRSASRQRNEAGSGTRSRASPQKPPRNVLANDVFVNEIVHGTPASSSATRLGSRLKDACSTFDIPKPCKADRSGIVLPEVEVSMSTAYDEKNQLAPPNGALSPLYPRPPHEAADDRRQAANRLDQRDGIRKQQGSSDGRMDKVEVTDEEEMGQQHELELEEHDGRGEQLEQGEKGEEDMEIDEERQTTEVSEEATELQKEKENIEASNDNRREVSQTFDKGNVLISSQLKNKNLMNVNVANINSYEVTPEKKLLPSTDDNYNIDDLSSGDETDDEDRPRKAIPVWANPENLRRALREQRVHPPIDVDTFFGEVVAPDLQKLFSRSRTRYRQRTSSANWSSPLSNPTKGTSTYFAIQNASKR